MLRVVCRYQFALAMAICDHPRRKFNERRFPTNAHGSSEPCNCSGEAWNGLETEFMEEIGIQDSSNNFTTRRPHEGGPAKENQKHVIQEKQIEYLGKCKTVVRQKTYRLISSSPRCRSKPPETPHYWRSRVCMQHIVETSA